MFGVPHPDEVYTYRTLREYFAATLDQVASRLTHHKKLVIVLDGVERLSSSAADSTEDSLHSLSWLPDAWPKHVHVVFTTDSAHLLSMRHLANHIRNCVRHQVAALSTRARPDLQNIVRFIIRLKVNVAHTRLPSVWFRS